MDLPTFRQSRHRRRICAKPFHIRPDLHRGRVLVIENFAVVSLIGVQQAAAALLAAMEQLAREQGCACLAISLLNRKDRKSPNRRHNPTGQLFKGAGFRLDMARLSKCFDAAAARQSRSDGRSEPSEGDPERP